MKKKMNKILIVFVVILGCIGISKNVYAETVLKDRNMTIISGEWNDICAFKYTQGGYYIYMDAEVKDVAEKSKCTPKDLKAQLFYYKNGNSFDPDDKEIVLDSINFGDDMSAWIYEDNNENMNRLKYGKKYYLGINNYSDSNYKIHYKIMYYPTGSADKVTMPKQITVKLAEYGTIKPEKIEPATGFSNIEEWKISNKNLEILGTPDGKCEIYAKKKGTTYITAIQHNGERSVCKVVVTGRPPKLNYNKFVLNAQKTLKAELLYADGKIKWSSSNPQIATVSSKGTIKAKRIGECTITARYKKVNYTAKVIVKREYPNYHARLSRYNTRDNYFEVYFKNKSGKPITIYPSNAKVEHVAYRTYDRYLRLSGGNTITIPAGKSQYVRFYVQGGLTWYDCNRYTLFYQMGFDGAKYEAHVWTANSVFKLNNKWYYTEPE